MDFNFLPRFKTFHFLITIQIPIWAKTFGVEEPEIERQIGIAHTWIHNNPKKGPKKDVMRFLNNWMQIADRKGSMRHRPIENFKENVTDNDTMTGDDWARIKESLKSKLPDGKDK